MHHQPKPNPGADTTLLHRVVDAEVRSQLEDETHPGALDEALDLRSALMRRDGLSAAQERHLSRLTAEEAQQRVASVMEGLVVPGMTPCARAAFELREVARVLAGLVAGPSAEPA